MHDILQVQAYQCETCENLEINQEDAIRHREEHFADKADLEAEAQMEAYWEQQHA